MSRRTDAGLPALPSLSRRQLIGRAASTAATLVISQSLLACAGSAPEAASDGETDTGTTPVVTPGANSCVMTAGLTEGPYFIDEKLNRSDIRTDPATGAVSAGVPLNLTFNVSRIANSACTPLTGAYLDVWHADASGNYSDVQGGGAGKKFLRGYQVTDANGVAAFTTIYPGWYQGRAVHIHFKLRLFAGSSKTYEFTSQFFFDESLTTAVHSQAPYNTRGTRDTMNTRDGIYNSLSTAAKAALTMQSSVSSSGYNGVIDLGVSVG